ncbi:MAG: ABC transporter substrate-binding protein [Candidatus Binatia bacterium]
MSITRRAFISTVAVGVAGLPLMGGLSRAQARGKLGYMKIADTAPMFVAMEKGFFKAEGLELETIPMAGGAIIVQGVTSGDLQFGWTNVISLYQAHVAKFDFKLIAGGATNVKGSNDTHAIEVLKTSPIVRAKDLEDKTVAVNTLNNIVHLMAMAWIDQNGADSSKVKFVEIPFPNMAAALAAGQIDAISVQEPFATAAVEKGAARVLVKPWGEVQQKFLIASWFASEKWIQKNRQMTQAFVRAINRGIDAIHADPAVSRSTMIKWTGLSPDLVAKIQLPVFEKTLSERDLQATIDLAAKYKMIPRPFKASEVISPLAPKA